ncbi:MAG: MmgE/PrpD family protein [Anaerovoracaceae bacterium]
MTDSFLSNLILYKENKIDSIVLEKAKESLFDYLGVCISGAEIAKRQEGDVFSDFAYCNIEKDITENIQDFIESKNVFLNKPIGCDFYTDFKNAALINGYHSHLLELDDGHRGAMMHPGSAIFSGLMPLFMNGKINYYKLLESAILGYETGLRLALSIQPEHKKRGFHASASCGTLASALAIAFALEYNYEKLKSTFAVALTMSSGLLEMTVDASKLKAMNSGTAALRGVAAAEIGALGLTSPKDPLGGCRGFLNCFGNVNNDRYFKDDYDEDFLILSTYKKPYSACRHSHPGIEAALEIRKRNNFNIKEIDSIAISTYDLAILGHDHILIDGVESAKMSIPYGVAAALLFETGENMAFEKDSIIKIKNSDLLELITIKENPDFSAMVPNKRPADLEISLKNGDNFYYKVEYPLGEPENPMNINRLKIKFIGLVEAAGKSLEYAENVFDAVFRDDDNNIEFRRLINQ